MSQAGILKEYCERSEAENQNEDTIIISKPTRFPNPHYRYKITHPYPSRRISQSTASN